MTRARDLAAFAVLTLLFGGAFPAIEVGLEHVPPLLLAGTRYAVSGVLLLSYAIATSDRWRPGTRADWVGVLGGGVFFVGGTGLSFVGQQFTTAGVAAVIFSAIPILTVAFARVLLPDERVSRRGAVGLLVGLLGVAIVVNPDPANLASGTVGQLLVFLAAVSVTFGTVVVRRSNPSISVVALTGWAMVVGAAVQFGFGAALGESTAAVRPTPAVLAAVAYLSVFAGGIGFVIYFGLLSRFGPLEVNLVSYLVPVVSVTVGWALLDEPISSTTVVGFGVIALGFLLLKEKELAAEFARYRGAAR